MIKILVSGVGADVAQGVIKCLKKSTIESVVYKIGHTDQESWLYLDEYSFISPPVKSDKYIEYLCELINKHNIDVFIPCVDSEILKVSTNRGHIENKTNCLVAVGYAPRVMICEDKYLTYSFLKDHGFSYPETHLASESARHHHFPLILKSKRGCGSKEVVEIDTPEHYHGMQMSDHQILQEKLLGDEYTAGIYLGTDAEVKGICIFKRKLKNGSTYHAERIIDEEMEAVLCSMAKTLGLPYVNIQFKLKDGVPCPFEFNGRFSGTTGIISRVFNAPEMYLKERFFNEVVEPVHNVEKFYVMRYYDEIYANEEQVKALIGRSSV